MTTPSPFPKKSLGQHWLFDEASLNAMVDAGKITEDDTVLEVGPGLGTLTKKLCQTAKEVIAVELDDTLAAQLPQNLRDLSFPRSSSLSSTLREEPSGSDSNESDEDAQISELNDRQESSANKIAEANTNLHQTASQVGDDKLKNLKIINQNILEFNLSQLPPGYKVIANIPYYLTSNLIRRMLESTNPPSVMVLLVQKEVAERIAANPGDMSILAVATQFYAEVELKELVPAALFTPPPKVDSQIIQITRRKQPLFPDVNTKGFFHLVRAGFSEKRKKLRSSLSGGLHMPKDQVDSLLKQANISENARAQELTLDQWHELYHIFPFPGV